jgi:hypothetical protein
VSGLSLRNEGLQQMQQVQPAPSASSSPKSSRNLAEIIRRTAAFLTWLFFFSDGICCAQLTTPSRCRNVT